MKATFLIALCLLIPSMFSQTDYWSDNWTVTTGCDSSGCCCPRANQSWTVEIYPDENDYVIIRAIWDGPNCGDYIVNDELHTISYTTWSVYEYANVSNTTIDRRYYLSSTEAAATIIWNQPHWGPGVGDYPCVWHMRKMFLPSGIGKKASDL